MDKDGREKVHFSEVWDSQSGKLIFHAGIPFCRSASLWMRCDSLVPYDLSPLLPPWELIAPLSPQSVWMIPQQGRCTQWCSLALCSSQSPRIAQQQGGYTRYGPLVLYGSSLLPHFRSWRCLLHVVAVEDSAAGTCEIWLFGTSFFVTAISSTFVVQKQGGSANRSAIDERAKCKAGWKTWFYLPSLGSSAMRVTWFPTTICLCIKLNLQSLYCS